MPRKKAEVAEVKEEKPEPIFEEKRPLKERVAKAVKIIIGILIILGGGFLIWTFLPEFLEVLKGTVGVILILIGLIVVALGWLD